MEKAGRGDETALAKLKSHLKDRPREWEDICLIVGDLAREAERSLIETVSPGSSDKLLTQLQAGTRVTADPAARAKADTLGNPTGKLQDPTITMHTQADPLVLVQNETVFRSRAAAAKGRTADLVQLYTAPPAKYSSQTGAPYGAGHCNFTTSQRIGVINLLDGWVHKGVVPAANSVAEDFPGDPSVSAAFNPGPWPAAGPS